MPRFNKDRYITDDSFTVPVESLHPKTKRNLALLTEHYGIDWDDEALSIPTQDYLGYFGNREEFEFLKSKIPKEEWSEGMNRAESSGAYYTLRYSYLIEGTGPDGEEVVYFRRETANPSSGETSIYIDGVKHRATQLIKRELLTDTGKEDWGFE